MDPIDTRSLKKRHADNIRFVYQLDKRIEKLKAELEALNQTRGNIVHANLSDYDFTQYNKLMELKAELNLE